MKAPFTRVGSIATTLLLSGLCLTDVGCGPPGLKPGWGSTPTLSRSERYTRISRNWALEYQMLNDDIDTALMLRPVSGLTEWTVSGAR